MKRKIYLYGRLKKKFGPVHEFAVETAGEAFRALANAFPKEFVEEIRKGSYQIIRGDRRGGMELDLDLLNTLKLGKADLHIIPVAEGASRKGRGTTKAIIGVAIVGAAIFFSGGTLAAPLANMSAPAWGILGGGLGVTWGNIAMLGLGIALMGAAYMKSPAETPKTDDTKQDHSFAFSGPVNVNEQGNAIPLIYGQVITGMQPISVDFDIENVGAYSG